MPFDTKAVLAEIDDVLARYHEVEKQYRHVVNSGPFDSCDYINAPEIVTAEIIALLHGTLNRLAPLSDYRQKALKTVPHDDGWESKTIRTLAGILSALRADYSTGRIQTIRERIHSDVFSDFLEMAEYLLDDEGLKDPAAVLAGGVLEEHLRKLCVKHSVPLPAKPKLDTINADLAKQGVYGKNDQQQITAWAGIRNDAAHANYDKYTAEQVRLMVQGIRHFLSSFAA
jgi:hypothetical protein